MARISLPSEAQVDPQVNEIYEQVSSIFGFVPNLVKALAHCPEILKVFLPCLEVTIQGDVDPKLKEVAILRVASLNRCLYLVKHHQQMAEGLGLSKEKIRALNTSSFSKDVWSESEKMVITLAEEMTQQVSAKEETLTELKKFFKEPEIVELTFTISLFNLLTRFISTLDLELEF